MEGRLGHHFGRMSLHPMRETTGSTLTLGRTDDPSEREADRAATHALRAPNSSGPETDRTVPYDFGFVRIHTDDRAAESAQAVNAQAYTAGPHIVFGRGQYDPFSTPGRWLLAHELSHVVQQNPGVHEPFQTGVAPGDTRHTLRRAEPASGSGPFAVSGLYPEREEEPDFIFFDWAEPAADEATPEAALDPAEREKIIDKAGELTKASPDEITLYGFASEEGGRGSNRELIDRRLTAVEHVLKDPGGYRGEIHRVGMLSESKGKLDYRFWRCVEIRPGAVASERKTQEGEELVDCNEAQKDLIDERREAAVKLIDRGLPLLDSYINDPQDTESEKTQKAISALDNNFAGDHSVDTAKKVRERVAAIRTFIDETMEKEGVVQCATEFHSGCRAGGAAAADEGEVFFCPTLFPEPDEDADLRWNPEEEWEDFSKDLQDIFTLLFWIPMLLHEAAHATGFEAKDRAYRHERVLFHLSTEEALDNAESLTIFIQEIGGKRPSNVGPSIEDAIVGCADDESVERALAWAQRWNMDAMFGLANTYDEPGRMRRYIERRFGRSDRAARAGIFDRYHGMVKIFDEALDVVCVEADAPECTVAASAWWELPDEVFVCPAFFSKKGEEQTKAIYAALALEMPGVTEKHARAYPELARDYMIHYWEKT